MATLNESFSVPNADQSWAVISDLNKLIPCVPGAKVVSAESPNKATAEITVKMGSMGMVFTGPVEIKSANAGSRTAQISANTREKGGQSNAAGDVTISMSGSNVTINANANVSGKAASMGEGTVQAVLTELVKQFSGNISKA